MRLSKLYIENYMCYEKAYIDFSQGNPLLIIGKVENNESYSNGVGKTTIFKAIEYALFNQADINLENIIRDDAPSCKIVVDFYIGDQEYRLSRKRTKKGATDLCLWQKNSVDGTESEVYHTICIDGIHLPWDENEKFWKDISCRRAADTEKELEKLIKINFKSFRGTVHFMQSDFSGLTTATPEKRKTLFKEILYLIVYSKLEKITKEKASLISKEIDKHKIMIEAVGDPNKALSDLKKQLKETETLLVSQTVLLVEPTKASEIETEKLNWLISSHKELENKYSFLLVKEKNLISDKTRIETSAKEYQAKKNSATKLAKEIVEELKTIKNTIDGLSKIDLSQMEILANQLTDIKQEITRNNILFTNSLTRYEELKIPVPDENICKHCRQIMTEEHKKVCKAQITKEMNDCQVNIKDTKREIGLLNNQSNVVQQKIVALSHTKHQLDELNNKQVSKTQELQDKKNLHSEYSSLVEKFSNELSEKEKEIASLAEDLKNSSLTEAEKIKDLIEEQKRIISSINSKLLVINKEIGHLNASKAVISHNIEQNNKEKLKLETLSKNLSLLEKKYTMYPHVLQAFSSTGIPNLIIQNVLEDLQNKANELLTQLKPGMQLSFLVEKTKDDGSEADTLDIKYYVNGRERYYEQLSGAMKVSVMFSLKLGLSHLLQNMFGTDIRFLLLDEIDSALDKASIDAFADIVKFFQNDYTMMVITHNDRLKEKKSVFSHAICVEQDINMVSRAKVVNSW